MNTPHASGPLWELFNGDCAHIMRNMSAESVDSIVTDPPYGLSFMGKEWDHGIPGSAFWVEALRVAKPGAHLLAFGGTRTFHRLAVAIEDAGWEIRDCVMWLYGKGFPKSHNIGKAIDKCDAIDQQHARRLQFTAWVRSQNVTAKQIDDATKTQMGGHYTTHPTQPAIMTREHLEMCRHLFSDIPQWVENACNNRGVVSENFTRRPIVETVVASNRPGFNSTRFDHAVSKKQINKTTSYTDDAKRWEGWGTALKPAWEPVLVCRKPIAAGMTVAGNVVAHGCGALNVDACRIAMGSEYDPAKIQRQQNANGAIKNAFGAGSLIGTEIPTYNANGRWPANVAHDGSDDVLALIPSDGVGSAARFFYCAKASDDDRNDGGTHNTHPTVKPHDLMRWLCRMVTPPGGTVLDPFMGSGSTGKAAIAEGFRFVGIDIAAEYCDIAAARIRSVHNLFNA